MPNGSFSETSASAGDWPEIEPSLLDDGRPSVPSFPLDVLPAPWRSWVADSAHSAGAPDDYVAQALLAAVAGLCGAGVRAQVGPAWSEPLVFWQALVGEPSSGKTSALDAIRRPLATVETLLQRNVMPAKAERNPRVVVGDAGFAALVEAVKARPEGVLLWRDDPSAWLAGLGRDTRNQGDARGWLLDAWSARAAAPAEPPLAVSIVGSLHAAHLDDALLGANDGLAARILFAWPNPAPWRPVADAKPAREDEAVTMLHRLGSAVGSPKRPLVLAFDEAALKAFDRFLRRLHDDVRRADGLEAGWLGRGRGTVVRLAAALALLDWMGRATDRPPRTIDLHHLQGAGRLWADYFGPHARAVFARGAPSTQYLQTRRAVHWLEGRKAREVSREDIRRGALSQSVTADAAQQVIYCLEKSGILRAVRDEPVWRNGRPARRWQVNPALFAERPGPGGAERLAETAQTPTDVDTLDVSAAPAGAAAG